jgi:predicted TIM-barrel fold metal-dependent hydrolase
MSTSTIPLIVSVDDHLVEPADLWTSRVPEHMKDKVPHVVMAPIDGTPILDGAMYIEKPGTTGKVVPWWNYEEHWYTLKRAIAAAGYPADEVSLDAVGYDEMRQGCWDPAERLKDMTANHIEASLCFPNYPRFAGQIFLRAKDKDVSLLCVRAYNDYMVEEWCDGSDGRLVPVCIVPLWDVDLAVEELLRNAARGVRAVAFSECPAWLDLPSIHSGYWDPFFAACAETGTVVAMHIGSGTRTTRTSSDAPDAVHATSIFMNSAASMIDFLFSSVLHRFPQLKLFYAEAQIGWIPFALDRCDDVWETHRWSIGDDATPEPPSFYYHRQIASCFFKDPIGLKLLDEVGRRNIMFETDYPHQDGTFPNTLTVAEKLFGELDQQTVNDIARNNAIDWFDLDLAKA